MACLGRGLAIGSRPSLRSVRITQVDTYSMWNRKKTTFLSHNYLRNRSNSGVVMLGFITAN
jgi:Na+/pantothenate symporter